jgi:hypothetical protein
MALIDLGVDRVKRSTITKRAEKKPQPSIWERYHGKAKSNINESIEDWNNRYGNGTGGNRVKASPPPKPTPSKNWRVVPGTDALGDKEGDTGEILYIFWKAGPGTLELWDEVEGDAESTKLFMVPAVEALPALNALKGAIDGLTKDSDLGKLFHSAAINVAAVRAKGTYNAEADRYE